MAIETLDDIIEQLADWIGVYGAHGEPDERPGVIDDLHCRVCFQVSIRQRIEAACNIEALMRRVTVNPEAK
jgi:hypothetical protein